MNKTDYPEPIRTLIGQFKRLPGIGPKSAERMVVWLLRGGSTQLATELATALTSATLQVSLCPECGFFSSHQQLCVVCASPHRDASLLCVVEQSTDILPLERTGAFKGHYHVLGGRISPLENIGPEQIRIDALQKRVRLGKVQEIILAVGSDVEGEATANYISSLLKGQTLKITRIAQGLPAGGGLESADELTLYRALQGRRIL